jgi:hypothetical protein
MSLVIATRAELIKNKRSAAFWLCFIGSAFIPFIFFLTYSIRPDLSYPRLAEEPWQVHLGKGWQNFSAFLLPMFVILTCSLIPQVEYKNNTWKQVFASPLSIGDIFFSKYLSIIAMVLFLFVMFNIFMLLAGVSANLVYSKYTFLHKAVDWTTLISINVRSFISLLAIISIQYWLSLRFRNFIVPIGIGLGLLVTALILMPWEHINKVPYAFPLLSFSQAATGKRAGLLATHEIYSIVYFLLFSLLAFADMRFRKERG